MAALRHGLFVVRPIGGQPVLVLIEGFANSGDVAVTEDREDAAEERNDFVPLRALEPRAQTGKVADQGLRRRQPHSAALAAGRVLCDGRSSHSYWAFLKDRCG